MPQNEHDIAATVLNWSSGKDAALAYYMLQQDNNYHVKKLLTTVSEDHGRIVMHGVREELLDAQADRMNVPIRKIRLPSAPSDDIYSRTMRDNLEELKAEGIVHAAFGDIFLEDLKAYREQQLAQAGFGAVFPLWKKDTRHLVQLVEQAGIEAIIVCVNEKNLGKEFLGRKIDTSLLNEMPAHVDPCGENGEFHTFVYDAPYFSAPVPVQQGQVVHRQYKNEAGNWDAGFWFLDLIPGG